MGAGRDLLGRRVDGSVFPVEVGLSPIHTSEGLQIVAIVTDITKRKHAEQRSILQRDVALLLSRADSIESVAPNLLGIMAATLGWKLAALWLVDTELDVLRNTAFWRAPGVEAPEFEAASLRLSFRSGESLLGEVWRQGKPVWIPDMELAGTFSRAEEAKAIGLHSTFKLPILVGEQTLGIIEFFSHEIRPCDEDLMEIGVAVASQISQFMERKRSERALDTLQQQYLHSQKMEAVGRLAGGVAHDFNNLLTIIAVSNDTLIDRLGADAELRQTADEISRATEQGASLVRQLMTFSRTQPQTTQALNVNEVIKGSQRILGLLAGEDIKFELDLHPDECPVLIESSRLEQVLMNLVSNSRDAMPNGGVIRIKTTVADVDQEMASRYVGLKPRKHVAIRVSDNGHGIPEDIQAHIFEPFFSTKEEGSGTGLGLSSVYGIVRQHGGYITCDSTVDEGATFTVFLPLADPANAGTLGGSLPSKVRRGSETILLVEDQVALRSSIRRILEQNGYKVAAAADAREALKTSEESEIEYDLLVTDIVLPQMRGTELAARLIDRFPQMRVLYMSGHSEEKIPSMRGSSFISKPFRREALIRKIREVLDT
jgi:signal transduction histidine kinase/CheY-like chemotaxis protein